MHQYFSLNRNTGFAVIDENNFGVNSTSDGRHIRRFRFQTITPTMHD